MIWYKYSKTLIYWAFKAPYYYFSRNVGLMILSQNQEEIIEMNDKQLAEKILLFSGGEQNIKGGTHCGAREFCK